MSAYDAGLNDLLKSAAADLTPWIARILALSISYQVRLVLSSPHG